MNSEKSDSFTFSAAGDSILTRSVIRLDDDPAFNEIARRLRSADVAFTNLEAVVTDGSTYATPPRAVPAQYQYLSSFPGMILRTPPALLEDVKAMGFDLVSSGSNHTYDFGRVGMLSTMEALSENSIPYAGLGESLPKARSPTYITTPHGRVGLVHATTSAPPGSEAGPPSSHLPGRPGINSLHVDWTYKVTEEKLEALVEIAEEAGIERVKSNWVGRAEPNWETEAGFRFMHMRFKPVSNPKETGIHLSLYPPDKREVLESIREADAMADWVVVSVHSHQGPGGTRNVPETPTFLEDFARESIEAGGDIFVGTGPHVLRGIEVYNGKPIFYSLGNFFAQFESLDLFPTESYDYYGVNDDRYPSKLLRARYYEDEEPSGNLTYQEYWETVVPTCEFDKEGNLERIELLPCSLGQDRPSQQRGTPKRANGNKAETILQGLAALSDKYGTEINTSEGVGIVNPTTTP